MLCRDHTKGRDAQDEADRPKRPHRVCLERLEPVNTARPCVCPDAPPQPFLAFGLGFLAFLAPFAFLPFAIIGLLCPCLRAAV